jgi:hypothetical protein
MSARALQLLVYIINKEIHRHRPTLRHICVKNNAVRRMKMMITTNDFYLLYVAATLSTLDKNLIDYLQFHLCRRIYL